VYSAPDWLVLHDISADGRVLLSRNSIRINVACQAPGEVTERDLGWLVASSANGLSSDGHTLIFSDGLSGRTREGNATVFRRRTDGSPAVSLGEARGGGALSPDGRWVLAEAEGIDSPAGGRFDQKLSKGGAVQPGRGAWLSDSKRIVFMGDPGDEAQRLHPQIAAGLSVVTLLVSLLESGSAATTVLGHVGVGWLLFRFRRRRRQPVPALKQGISCFTGATTAGHVYRR
jgi:hypothetical protein